MDDEQQLRMRCLEEARHFAETVSKANENSIIHAASKFYKFVKDDEVPKDELPK